MKILVVVPSYPKISGVDYHRLVVPHNQIALQNEVEIDMATEIDSAEIEFLKEYDLVVANRFISKTLNTQELIVKLKDANVPYILDLDDDYQIPSTHILHEQTKRSNHAYHIKLGGYHAQAITCTHGEMKKMIRAELLNENVYVVPNGINPIEQFEVKEVGFDMPTFGWSGSITHFEDVLLMVDSLYSVYKSEYRDKMKMVYGGYDGKNETSQAIAGVLSAKGNALPDHFFLFPATDVTNYAQFYDRINIALIPLRKSRFNSMKSNLKLLEAGFKKKAVIVSGVEPYLPMLKHGENCLVANTKKDWYKHMTYLIDNPHRIQELAENLHKDVQLYHIDNVAKTRFETYKKIVNDYRNRILVG
jgi:glycosyltransferase involved in cell wall biosynthesis